MVAKKEEKQKTNAALGFELSALCLKMSDLLSMKWPYQYLLNLIN